MLTTSLVLAATALAGPVDGTATPVPSPDGPRVAVWTNREDPYRSGERVRVFVRADRDAFVSVLRVDTDGQIHVLYPRTPHEDAFLRGGAVYEISGPHTAWGFFADRDPGMGYVFAVASSEPFDYRSVALSGQWHYAAMFEGRVRGDPYVALTDLAGRIVVVSEDAWDYDISPYYVEAAYSFPRFLCYDCHAYTPFRYWNPYRSSCTQFRVVVYDDPYYYPYRRYGGTRVVFTRPAKIAPRYVFKTWDDGRAFVTTVRSRDAETRTGERLIRSSVTDERVPLRTVVPPRRPRPAVQRPATPVVRRTAPPAAIPPKKRATAAEKVQPRKPVLKRRKP